jgi:acetyl esterase/lipase
LTHSIQNRLPANHSFFKWLLLACLLTGCVEAQLFYINAFTNFDTNNLHSDIPYDSHKLNHLDIYKPQGNTPVKATVIFFYGGCWGGCETYEKASYAFVAQALTSHGYVVIIPDYRRHPDVKYDTIIGDAINSVDWVKKNISKYGGTPDKIFIMGHSAGAHLGVMMTLNEHYLPPSTYQSIKGFIGLAGPYDFLPFTEPYQKIVFGPEEKYPNSQPINFVDGSEPPLLLLYGANDDTVKPFNIKRLSYKVNAAHGCVESHIYNDLNHGELIAALSIPLQKSKPVLPDIINFLDYYGQSAPTCRNINESAKG